MVRNKHPRTNPPTPMTSFDISSAQKKRNLVGVVMSSDVSGSPSGDAAAARGAGVREQLV